MTDQAAVAVADEPVHQLGGGVAEQHLVVAPQEVQRRRHGAAVPAGRAAGARSAASATAARTSTTRRAARTSWVRTTGAPSTTATASAAASSASGPSGAGPDDGKVSGGSQPGCHRRVGDLDQIGAGPHQRLDRWDQGVTLSGRVDHADDQRPGRDGVHGGEATGAAGAHRAGEAAAAGIGAVGSAGAAGGDAEAGIAAAGARRWRAVNTASAPSPASDGSHVLATR